MNIDLDLNQKRPLKEIIKYVFKLYKNNFNQILKSSFFLFIPIIFTSILSLYISIGSEKTVDINSEQFRAGNFNNLLYFIIYSLILIVLHFFYKIGIINIFINLINNNQKTLKETIIDILKDFFPLFITVGCLLIALLSGAFFFIVPGLIISGYTVFITQIIIFEKKYYFPNIKRSFFISSDYLWENIVLVILYYFIILILSLAFQVLIFYKDIISIFNNTSGNNLMNNNIPFLARKLFTSLILIITQPILHFIISIKFLNIKMIKEKDEDNVYK